MVGSKPIHRNIQIIFSAIIIAQFFGTSLWFAGNAILPQLQQLYHWPVSSLGHLTTAVQVGFIACTLCIALTGLADKISPSLLFFISCSAGAVCNGLAIVQIDSYPFVLVTRALTGFCLGGIYPIGMKIASDWRKEGLGDWLGALVGALVLGTALPHALRALGYFDHPTYLILGVSAIAAVGGLLLFALVPDGPYQKKALRFSIAQIHGIFSNPAFKAPTFGYLGHMWELYAFWAFVPWAMLRFLKHHPEVDLTVAWASFLVIGIGGFGCWLGGKISRYTGSAHIARVVLLLSGFCCLLSPLIWQAPPMIFLGFYLFWGFAVVTDSPQFSALVAAHAPAENRGTAITLVTCLGFFITIISIQLLNYLEPLIQADYLFLMLAPGPIIGLLMSKRNYKNVYA